MEDYPWPDDFWPHQLRACEEVRRAIEAGYKRIVLTAPCGCGKSRVQAALTEWGADRRWETTLYTHRRILCRQTSDVLTKHGIDHGLRASGYRPALLRPVQLAMVQTERAAVLKNESREIHHSQLVISDEIHAMGGESLPELHRRHYEEGAAIVGVTATPINLTGEWDKLIIACKTSEGRKCGALLWAITYSIEQPDLQHVGRVKVGEDLSERDNARAMFGPKGVYRPKVFGRVFQHWKRLNPKQVQTILFAPDVAGSLYFAEEFTKQGVSAAHIDAKNIWHMGETVPSDDENREWLFDKFKSGEITLLCNRFLLREGIDLPCVGHAIFACVVGSLQTWLQMGGRALRSYPGMTSVCIQDHGGNYIRAGLGSLNADRNWELGMNSAKIMGMAAEERRENPQLDPITCPRCGMTRLRGPRCEPSPPGCGFAYEKRSRMVVQHNGELKLVEGPAYRKHYVKREDDTEAKWRSMYNRAKSKKWDASFSQAAGLFAHENGYWPPKDLPFMPIEPQDWFEKVSKVPTERLR